MKIENVILTCAETTDPLDLSQLTTWLRHIEADSLGESKRIIVDGLFPGSGDLLKDLDLTRVIRADLPELEIVKLIGSRKSILRRMAVLLPQILNTLSVKDIEKARTVTLLIDDTVYDFGGIVNADQKRKNERIALSAVDYLGEQCTRLLDALSKAKRYIDIEYDQYKKYLVKGANKQDIVFDDLNKDLADLKFVVELSKVKHQLGEGVFYLSGNAGKSYIVECAYTLSMWMDTPKFTTTPGSQFSFLCSLIYEIATGKADESLAWAINRFYSSDDKKRTDREAIEYRTEEDTYESGDNFAVVRSELRHFQKELELWQRVISHREWSKEHSHLIYLQIKGLGEHIEECSNRVGPFLIWAHQSNAAETREVWDLTQSRQRDLLAKEIALGRARRRAARN
jgi:hypothetical protein